MDKVHIKETLSEYLDGKLDELARRPVEDHLVVCPECRGELEDLRFGASIAKRLEPADAPYSVWVGIEDALEGKSSERFGLMPPGPAFSFRRGFAFATALIAVSALAVVIFNSLFVGDSPYRARVANENFSGSAVPANSAGSVPNSNSPTNVDANLIPTNTNNQQLPTDGWRVETVAGAPTVEGSDSERIAVGQLLETDGKSRARIAVADIGTVDVSPNSRVRLAGTGKDEHRLALERGQLHAKIFAPPRLFIVDTPSAKAVDLGCEYTLEVDEKGNSILSVTGGWVALERGGRESIVPAGMMCKTTKGIGLGTPFSPEATERFRKALDNFDFTGGGTAAIQTIVREADFYDMFTLWHLLSRVRKEDRGIVYDTLSGYVSPPAGVTRDGVIALDKKMLEAWKTEVETAWFN